MALVPPYSGADCMYIQFDSLKITADWKGDAHD